MKCYYTYNDKGEKVFIPMCWGTIYSNDLDDCHCQEPLTEYHFQKERFNQAINKKNETIKSMECEIKHLRKVIQKLNK